ncbi:flagellar motor switch protein FliN [Listeria monocytogenes]|nr:flagellar motor switch protein FliN [Listeria monocytogenes]
MPTFFSSRKISTLWPGFFSTSRTSPMLSSAISPTGISFFPRRTIKLTPILSTWRIEPFSRPSWLGSFGSHSGSST